MVCWLSLCVSKIRKLEQPTLAGCLSGPSRCIRREHLPIMILRFLICAPCWFLWVFDNLLVSLFLFVCSFVCLFTTVRIGVLIFQRTVTEFIIKLYIVYGKDLNSGLSFYETDCLPKIEISAYSTSFSICELKRWWICAFPKAIRVNWMRSQA